MAEGTDRYTATRLSAELGLDSLARAWRPPPILTVSQWADQTRRLSPEASAEPGRWYTARAEYMRGVMDAVSDPTVRQVVVMSAAQVGKTEVLLNMICFHVDQDPAPILVVQPTEATELGQWLAVIHNLEKFCSETSSNSAEYRFKVCSSHFRDVLIIGPKFRVRLSPCIK